MGHGDMMMKQGMGHGDMMMQGCGRCGSGFLPAGSYR